MTSTDIRTEIESYRKAGLNGDDMAAKHLESQFGDALSRFVRRVVRTGRGTGSLADYVLQEASIVREQLGLERDELVSELISRLCSVITGQGIAGRVDTASVADRKTVYAS